MLQFIGKKLLLTLPLLFCINLFTFGLFFTLNNPDELATQQLGEKHATPEAIANWKANHGYDIPLIYNSAENGISCFTKTIFAQKSLPIFRFDFGLADNNTSIATEIKSRIWPSLAIAIPSFILGLTLNITVALFLVKLINTSYNIPGLLVSTCLMSISTMFFIIGGQYIFAKLLLWVPISGYVSGWYSIKFLLLPILIGVVSGLGAGIRWYRSLFLEEINKEYVFTARCKGLSMNHILWKHVFPNALLPILTGVVVVIPLLFLGSLLTESFFAIPGLGSYTIDAIAARDFTILRSIVFLGAVLYIIGIFLTDIAYKIADPRIKT